MKFIAALILLMTATGAIAKESSSIIYYGDEQGWQAPSTVLSIAQPAVKGQQRGSRSVSRPNVYRPLKENQDLGGKARSDHRRAGAKIRPPLDSGNEPELDAYRGTGKTWPIW